MLHAQTACLAWSVGRSACLGMVGRLAWLVLGLGMLHAQTACLAWSVGRSACFGMVGRLTWLVRRLGTLLVSPQLLAWLGRLVDLLVLARLLA